MNLLASWFGMVCDEDRSKFEPLEIARDLTGSLDRSIGYRLV